MPAFASSHSRSSSPERFRQHADTGGHLVPLAHSSGQWLRPSRQGMKIIPIGPAAATCMASWPAPLGSVRCCNASRSAAWAIAA
jgi:hypothetical protein